MKLILLSIVLLTIHFPVLGQPPDQDEFIEVDEEPTAIDPIGKYVIYPESARRFGIEGRVLVSALLDTTGDVLKVRIVESTHKIFEEPAMSAIKQSRFTPAIKKGKPIKLWYTVPISYKLKNINDEGTSDPQRQENRKNLKLKIDSLENLFLGDTTNDEVLNELSTLYARCSYWHRAMLANARYFERHPSNLEARLDAAESYAMAEGKYQEGLDIIDKILEIRPDYIKAMLSAAMLVFKMEKTPQNLRRARSYFDRAHVVAIQINDTELTQYLEAALRDIDVTLKRIE